MYNNYFGFKEFPFSIAPNPQFLYMSARHREALAHLLYGVQGNGGFILLTGEVGTGKTTVCRCLLEQMPADVDTAFLLNPKLTVLELLAAICDDLQIDYPPNAGLKVLVDRLNVYLLQSLSQNRQTLLIIDEAQNLSADVLEQLRLLTNLETNQKKLLQIILIGQPELLDLLERNELRQLNQRITARFHLEALNKEETDEYIAHRLGVAQGKGDVFTASAIRRVYQLSKGIPRLINLLCDRALLGTYAENELKVTRSIVSKAAKEIFGQSNQRRNRNSTGIIWLTGVGMIAGLLVTGAYLITERDNWVPENAVFNAPGFTDLTKPEKPLALAAVFDESSVGYADESAALNDLLALWGTPEELIDQANPCGKAPSSGLACFHETGNLQDILAYDRPAVIKISKHYFILINASPRGIQLNGPTGTFTMRPDNSALKTEQSFTLIWRLPPGYRSPLSPGDRGAAVDWLAAQMELINDRNINQPMGTDYSDALRELVEAFQSTRGLEPDGVVDARTWIHINSVQGLGIPFLKEKNV